MNIVKEKNYLINLKKNVINLNKISYVLCKQLMEYINRIKYFIDR